METVSVHDLVFDRALNPRQRGVDDEVVGLYAAIFRDVVWPPILVHRGSNRLLDGWHRVEAAKRASIYTLPVQWVDAQDEELFALAIKANLGHGVRLSREDRYKAIVRLMREGWTPERIADVIGVGLKTIEHTEKAEDFRIRYKVKDSPVASLPTETLVEVVKLPDEYHEDIAELACEMEAAPADVRRTARAIKKGLVETPQDIRRAMTDAEFVKQRAMMREQAGDGRWLMTFATLVDQLEKTQSGFNPSEQDAAITLFTRMRDWSMRQLANLGAEAMPPLLEVAEDRSGASASSRW